MTVVNPLLDPPRRRPAGRRDTLAALAPVVAALSATAQERAAAITTAAEGEAAAMVEDAEAEAARIVERARADGAAAGQAGAAATLVAAHRNARAVVLGARRAAFEQVRQAALGDLTERTTSAAGRALAARLETIVGGRAGPGATVQRTETGPLEVAATVGNRRAAVDLATLVDVALCALADEVALLWS